MFRRLAGASWLAALCACSHPHAPTTIAHEASAPHLRAPAEQSAHAHVHATAPDLAAIDPAALHGVSLDALLAYADAHSPDLLVARSTRSRAKAAHVAASPLVRESPELSLAAGPRLQSGDVGLDFEAQLSQRLSLSGERGARLAAADRLAELTDAEIEEIRWRVHCAVHAEFHIALTERERVKLAARVVAFQEDIASVLQRQITAGESAPLALRLSSAELAQAREQLALAEQAMLRSELRLAQLSGWPAESPPQPEGEIDAPREPPELAALLALAQARLPQLQTAGARIREVQARAEAADRARSLQPTVGVSLEHEGPVGRDPAVNVVKGTLSIPLPGFDPQRAEHAIASAELEVARAEHAALVQRLQAEIAQARSEVVAAARRSRVYGAEIVPQLEESLALLRRSFELGELDVLALSSGRERFLRIQSDALAAQRDYFVALAELERAVGADLWHDDHDAPAAPAAPAKQAKGTP